MMRYRIGIDVGGTFTDLVAVDEAGRIVHAKAASTPSGQSLGVMEGLGLLAGALDLGLPALLAATERIVHGTTVATNALLERKGARTALLTTEGHRDILEMRQGLKDDRYNLRMPPPEPLVPRHLRLGIIERIRHDGRIEVPLDPASVARAIEVLRTHEVEAVAICYLHSWRDPSHERATAETIRAALPGCYVSVSAEVLPQIKEYERTCTTVANAYVGPALRRYLARLAERLGEAGATAPLLIIQSHGGLATVEDAVRFAAGAVLSGPAGGVAGAAHVARLTGIHDLIPFDMGGTSTDISLITRGEAAITSDRKLADQRVGLQSLDIASIGAGGGSLARVDAGGVLHVGPESAGAMPGPACYGRGGLRATVTDANLVLGYLDAGNFLGGRAALDMAAAEAAVDRVAAALGVNRMAAAAGIHRVVNTRMAEGVRLVSVRRGIDPRRFALLSFGGAAGLHITDVARQVEITRVIVPRLASVLSAWGMLATDLRYELSRTHLGEAAALSANALRAVFADMERDGRARLAATRFTGEVRTQRSAEMRYGEQIFEVSVPLDGMAWDRDDLIAGIADAFHARHEELYSYALRDQEAVLVNARVTVIGALPSLAAERHAPPSAASASGMRHVHFGGWIDAATFDLDMLAPGQVITGPAIIESSTTTVLLRTGDEATVTPLGWLDVTVAGGGTALP
jgi:N-methylhydantoinase A